MLYLLVSLSLIIASVVLYVRARLLKLPIPTSTRVILTLFMLAGSVMTYFSFKEIDAYQYKRVEKICSDHPELLPMVTERGPRIQRYEYLDILEAEKKAKKALTR